jgi:4-carboxymuconolactone decarboxylase
VTPAPSKPSSFQLKGNHHQQTSPDVPELQGVPVNSRLQRPYPDEMTTEQRKLYDLYAAVHQGEPDSPFALIDETGRLQGPPAIWLLSQPLGLAMQGFGYAIRYQLGLSPRAQEIAILMVAHYRKSEFELYAHTRAGAQAGLSAADLAALAAGTPPTVLSDEERAVYQTTERLLRAGALDTNEYWDAVRALSVSRLFELVTVIGYYLMLATQLSVFDVQPPTM